MKRIFLIFVLFPIWSSGENLPNALDTSKRELMHNIISSAAIQNGISHRTLVGICRVESNLNPRVVNEDDGESASIGLCQIKSSTAKLYGYNYKKESLLDPMVNAKYASKHFRFLLDKYKVEDHAIAAYNLGHLQFNPRGLIWNRSYVAKVKKAVNEEFNQP